MTSLPALRRNPGIEALMARAQFVLGTDVPVCSHFAAGHDAGMDWCGVGDRSVNRHSGFKDQHSVLHVHVEVTSERWLRGRSALLDGSGGDSRQDLTKLLSQFAHGINGADDRRRLLSANGYRHIVHAWKSPAARPARGRCR